MRRLSSILLSTVALAIGSAGLASAADLSVRRPGPVTKAPVMAPAPVYDWTGFYIGAHAGYGWGTKDWSDPFDPFEPVFSNDVSGFLAGGQIGYNWQVGTWVFGLEGQASWSDIDGEDTPDETIRTKVKWLGTAAVRIGYAFDRVLVYAKGGAAFAHDEHEVADPFSGFVFASGDKTRWGWMAGGGIEVALGGNWSMKGEYNYMDFGNKSVTFTDFEGDTFPVDIDQQIHVVKFGVNYRFGGSPVVARY